MSDNLRDADWLAFVSDSGRVIGVGRRRPDTMVIEGGVAVAILKEAITLPRWIRTLESSPNLTEAVSAILHTQGGERIARPIDLSAATLVPMYGIQVGEA
jgi:hypothetical protein